MKNFTSFFIFLILIACTQNDPTVRVVIEQANPQGTETHGGDVLRARALGYRDVLTLNSNQLEEQCRCPNPKKSIREQTNYIWKGIAVIYKQIQKPSLRASFEKLIVGDTRGNIFDDIRNSPYEIKVFRVPTDTNPNKPEYGVCVDYHGQESTAGAGLNDRNGNICFDTKKLAEEVPTEVELIALASHEHAHHFNLLESEAIEIQEYITNNFEMLIPAANVLTWAEQGMGIVLDESEVKNGIKINLSVVDSSGNLNFDVHWYHIDNLFPTNGAMTFVNEPAKNQSSFELSFVVPPSFKSWSGFYFNTAAVPTLMPNSNYHIKIEIFNPNGNLIRQLSLKNDPANHFYNTPFVIVR